MMIVIKKTIKNFDFKFQTKFQNKGSKGPKGQTNAILFFILIVILLALVFVSAYFLYLNIPRAPEKLEVSVSPIQEQIQEQPGIQITEIKQFYPNMKFNHNSISYFMDSNCEQEKKQKMLLAFDELSDNVNIITFYKTLVKPDIEISCAKGQEIESELKEEKHFIAGEGGAKSIIPTGRYHIITEGVILLYENNEKKLRTIDCEYPNVELHELMHVFGFDHVDNKNSLMYQLIESCDQVLDSSIIELLNKIYTEENLAELYFENVNAVKKGRYLDFNLTIKNSGSIDSSSVVLTVLDNDEVVDKKDLGEIKFGAGITIETQNLKLIHLNPEKISFIIDKENKIKEINEKNNIANVS